MNAGTSAMFPFSTRNTLCGRIWSKISKLTVYAEIRDLVQFKYVEFDGDLHFFLQLEFSFLGKFGPKNQNCQFKLKFGTLTNSNMQNSMVVFYYFCFRPETTFLDKFSPEIKIFRLSWNLIPRLIRICRI